MLDFNSRNMASIVEIILDRQTDIHLFDQNIIHCKIVQFGDSFDIK